MNPQAMQDGMEFAEFILKGDEGENISDELFCQECAEKEKSKETS